MAWETGWQSITDKEGSTASGAMLTVKGSGAWRGSIASKGEQCQWSMANKKKKKRPLPGKALLAKGEQCQGNIANKREAMLVEH